MALNQHYSHSQRKVLLKAKTDSFVIFRIHAQHSCLEVQERYGTIIVESSNVPTKRLVCKCLGTLQKLDEN